MMFYLQEKFCMNPKNDLVKEWLKKSQHDLETAKVILAHKPELTDTICFHCQQAVEKTLKGYLVYLNIPFKKTHSLAYLLDLINDKEKIPENIYEQSELLENYAIEIRYPDDWYEPSIEDVKEAFNNAESIIAFFKDKINGY